MNCGTNINTTITTHNNIKVQKEVHLESAQKKEDNPPPPPLPPPLLCAPTLQACNQVAGSLTLTCNPVVLCWIVWQQSVCQQSVSSEPP